MAVDVLNERQALRQVIQGGDGAKLGDHRLGRLGRVGARCGEGGNDVVCAPQVLLPDDLGLAIDAFGLAGVIVGPAADGLFDDAGH